MKAMVYTEYGPPDVLQLKEVERPIPKDNEAVVEVHAASINCGDWGLLRGKPFFLRLTEGGLQEPKIRILGGDVAGRVEAVGRNAKQFRPGDEVFGDLSHSPNRNDLVSIKELLEAGKVVPVIDRRYPLDQVPEAFRYFGEGHARGKAVITVEHNRKT